MLDTTEVKNGKFHFNGETYEGILALIFTDPKIKAVDDSSVIRFLIEPSKITINFNLLHPSQVVINGSTIQKEFEKYQRIQFSIRKKLYKIRSKEDEYYIITKKNGYAKNHFINETNLLDSQYDSLRMELIEQDLKYIKRDTKSYLSSYLLNGLLFKIPIDSIAVYYDMLSRKVKKSFYCAIIESQIIGQMNNGRIIGNKYLVDKKKRRLLKKIHSLYDFTLKDSADNDVVLTNQKGKIAILNFWSTGCLPCLKEFPVLVNLLDSFRSHNIQLVSISVDNDFSRWKTFLSKNNLPGLQFFAPDGFDGLISLFYKVVVLPKMILIDQSGRIITEELPSPDDPLFIKAITEIS